MPTTNKPKKSSIAWRLGFIVAILAWTPAVTAWAQPSKEQLQTAYERALLDSAFLYQQLKPVHNSLQKAYDALKTETQALRQERVMLRMQAQIERETHQRSLEAIEVRRKRQRWLDRAAGFAFGLIF